MSAAENTRLFQIFKAGEHTAMSGMVIEYSKAAINTTAGVYNPAKHTAPLVLGHPSTNKPVYGEVTRLIAKGDNLYCLADVSDDLLGMVQRGHYKKISAAFFGPNAPENPVPGSWYLRHVGFLGANPPAVRGVAPLAFAESPGVVVVVSDFPSLAYSFSDYAQRRQERERLSVYEEARLVSSQIPEISFSEALNLVSH